MAGLRVSLSRRMGGVSGVTAGGVVSSRRNPLPGRGGRSRMGIAPLGMLPLQFETICIFIIKKLQHKCIQKSALTLMIFKKLHFIFFDILY
jgi:hypothetical protein